MARLDAALATELPPRTRRIPVKPSSQMLQLGTTSAYAENTLGGKASGSPDQNYLRVRGEYI